MAQERGEIIESSYVRLQEEGVIRVRWILLRGPIPRIGQDRLVDGRPRAVDLRALRQQCVENAFVVDGVDARDRREDIGKVGVARRVHEGLEERQKDVLDNLREVV